MSASIEITRSLFEGNLLHITSVRNTPAPALEKARGIRLYDGNKKSFDGHLRAPDHRRGSNKYRTLTTGVYDWRKELGAIYIAKQAIKFEFGKDYQECPINSYPVDPVNPVPIDFCSGFLFEMAALGGMIAPGI